LFDLKEVAVGMVGVVGIGMAGAVGAGSGFGFAGFELIDGGADGDAVGKAGVGGGE
jgi:hypothetical protein